MRMSDCSSDVCSSDLLGNVVEYGDLPAVFRPPKHPYTKALLASVPKLDQSRGRRLDPVRGMVPHPFARPSGCTFRDRCDHHGRASGRDRVSPHFTLRAVTDALTRYPTH